MGLLVVAFLAFVSLGLPDAVLGVAWPSVRREFGVPLSQLGVLLGAGMCGYLASSFSNGPIVARIGVGPLLTWSSALTAATAIGYSLAPSWPVMVGCALLGGLGAGAIDAGINAYAALAFSPRVMNWLHAAYGLGAAAGPALTTLILAQGLGWRAGYGTIAVILVVSTLCFALTLRLWQRGVVTAHHEAAAPITFAATLRRPVVWLHASLFAIYVGIEATGTQWLYSFFTESRGINPAMAGAWASLYWASLTAGRILVGIVASRIDTLTLLRVAMAGVCGGAALVWLSDGPWTGLAGVLLVGLAAGPIYPLLISETPARLGSSATGHAVGLQVAVSYLGAAAWPALAGVLARSLGLDVIGPFMLALAVALLALHEATRPSAQMTGGEAPGPDLSPLGHDAGAQVERPGATRVEPASRRGAGGARDLALQDDALAARRRMERERRGQ
jgi:fucose permease